LLLKNLSLLVETLTALFSSMVFASLVSTIYFDNFHILSLAFGMSITAVSIDYLLHYHLHGFYYSKRKINKSVLYGFLTTLIAFGVFSFIPIALISQISFFAVMSLSFAYVLFTFVFIHIKIKPYAKEIKLNSRSFNKIPAPLIFLISISLLMYSFEMIHLDSNIRNLDYQNTALKNLENTFKSANSQGLKPLIVEASNEEELLEHLQTVKQNNAKSFSLINFVLDKKTCEKKRLILSGYNFEILRKILNKEANKIGFSKDYFINAYDFTQEQLSCKENNLSIFASYNVGIYEDEGRFYSMAFVQETTSEAKLPFTSSLNIQEIFSKIAQKMYADLLWYASAVVSIILILLIFSVKRHFLYALNYIVFPLSFTLAVLVSFMPINLMHLFAMIILIAIGIDYGIYMSNSQHKEKTILAIKYSLLSTFAGFGVLVASSVVALNSIGLVVSLGVSAIFILIKVMK